MSPNKSTESQLEQTYLELFIRLDAMEDCVGVKPLQKIGFFP